MHDSMFFYGLLTATFLFAGMVKGVTGMGLPTVAMGLLGTVMPPAMAATLLVVPSLVTNVWQLFSGGAVAALVRRLWPMLAAMVIGTVGGSALLVRVDPRWSGFALGSALIVYAVYALLAPALSIPRALEAWLSPLVGLVTGMVTGATGVFAMPAVPYLGALGLHKDELVQALGLSFSISTLALAAGLLANDAFRLSQLGLSSLSVIPALLGMWLGTRVRARISPQRFRQCFLLLLLVLGLELASRPFF
nr:sulfite exporter TauE/SafE family protein [Comamonas koreensis]